MKNNPKVVIAAAVLMLAGVLSPGEPGHAMDEYDAPETVTMDTMANLYEPVVFSHKRHVRLARCKDCHHHTTGELNTDPNCIRCHTHSPRSKKIACSDCHSPRQFYPEQLSAATAPNIYHIGKPGLKGALHLNCIPCHQEKNAPTGCEGCHAMTKAGRDFFQVPETDTNDEAGARQAR
jgi:hypothetical protein